jgi:transcriptional regulator with GAF, ATPase, and Fis domain
VTRADVTDLAERLRALLDEARAAGRLGELLPVLDAEVRRNRLAGVVKGKVPQRFGMVGDSPAMHVVFDLLERVVPSDVSVLVQGETGTGKELVARAIHDGSGRRERPLISVNCAALPRELVESELFGHERGAFTGAVQQRRGRFELADGGSLFLDEVGELPPEAQAKLLRVLQEGEFERLGGARTLRADVRVIAATNRDLRAEVAAGRFRPDLFYRLDVIPIALPPLRARRDDIPLLVRHFAAKVERKLGRRVDGLDSSFIERACAYDWPGNVRELENLVERALVTSTAGAADALGWFAPSARPASADTAPAAELVLESVERSHICRILDGTHWQIEGEAGAARILGLNPSTLRGRMRKLGIGKAP